MTISLMVAGGAGLLSFLSPCVLPLVPSYLAFIAGVSWGDLRSRPRRGTRAALALNALGFVSGFSLVFMLMGTAAALAGGWVLSYRGLVQQIGGALIILFGLHLVGLLRPSVLVRQIRIPLASKPAGLFGSVAVGVVFGAGWTPCVGPVLGSILTLASTAGSAADGTRLLAAYAAGLAIPFLAAALLADQFLSFFGRFRPFLPGVDRIAGLVLIAVGTLLALNYMSILNAYFIGLTPQWLLERL